MCANRRCIQETGRCNGVNDCGDHSDEVDCGNSKSGSRSDISNSSTLTTAGCQSGSFACSNGHCINQSRVCDGHIDCQDENVHF